MDHFVLFSGNSHPLLANELAHYLKTVLGKIYFEPFPDGEIYLQIQENVRGRDVFVVQSIARDPNYYLMELLIMIDALKRASARTIVAVIPYFGYSRQDRKDKPRVPISAKLVADLLATAGATRVLTMDLHAGQIQGFFDIPVDNLYARPLLAEAVSKLQLKDLVIMAPDLGAIKIARAYANHLQAEFAVMDKRRVSSEKVSITSIIGSDVKGRDVLLVDDLCSTAGTLATAAQVCQDSGAKAIYAAFTHGLLVGEAISRLESSPIKKIFMCNTVPLEGPQNSKFEVVSIAPFFGEAIRCIISADSISSIFN